MSARERGTFTVETCIGIVFLVSALVFMVPYLQRALQGNLFGVNQSVGLQYDPRDGHTETQNLSLTETVTQQVRWAMLSADILPTREISPIWASTYNDPNPDWILESLPSGPVPREPAFQRSKVDASWTATQGSTYNDAR